MDHTLNKAALANGAAWYPRLKRPPPSLLPHLRPSYKTPDQPLCLPLP